MCSTTRPYTSMSAAGSLFRGIELATVNITSAPMECTASIHWSVAAKL